MKQAGLQQIIGKTIKAVVVRDAHGTTPPAQVFLVFTDGTSLEIYGELLAAGSLDTGGVEAAVAYAERFGGTVIRLG